MEANVISTPSLEETTPEQRIAIAYEEGVACAKTEKYDNDRYAYSGLKKHFDDGFVAQASHVDAIPIGTPMYLAGRISCLKGLPLEAKPESETYAGRWFSGWRMEKEREIARRKFNLDHQQ